MGKPVAFIKNRHGQFIDGFSVATAFVEALFSKEVLFIDPETNRQVRDVHSMFALHHVLPQFEQLKFDKPCLGSALGGVKPQRISF
jgi:hypothetical protein